MAQRKRGLENSGRKFNERQARLLGKLHGVTEPKHIGKKQGKLIAELHAEVEASAPTIHRSLHVMSGEKRHAKRMAVDTFNDKILRIGTIGSLGHRINSTLNHLSPLTTSKRIKQEFRKLALEEAKRMKVQYLSTRFLSPYHRNFYLMSLESILSEKILEHKQAAKECKALKDKRSERGNIGMQTVLEEIQNTVNRIVATNKRRMGKKEWGTFRKRNKLVSAGTKTAKELIGALGKNLTIAKDQATTNRRFGPSQFNLDLFGRQKEVAIRKMFEQFEKQYPSKKLGPRKRAELEMLSNEAEIQRLRAREEIQIKEQELEEYRKRRRFRKIAEKNFFREQTKLTSEISALQAHENAITELLKSASQRLKK